MKNLHVTLVGALLGLSTFLILMACAGPLSGSPAVSIAKNAGTVSYVLLWVSVMSGLLLSARLGPLKPAALNDVHQYVSQTALAFTAMHALMFLGGTRHPVNLLQIVIPFAWPDKTWEVALGQLALPLLLALVSTSLLRRRLGNRAWRLVHVAAYAGYGMALVHCLATGHDAWLYLGTAAPVVYLSTARVGLVLSKPLASMAARR